MAGMGFLLRPTMQLEELVETMVIEWQLSDCPMGTQAVCSLGEGLKVVSTLKPSILDECFFAVGPLQSYPVRKDGGASDHTNSNPFGMYWLETPDFDAPELGRKMQQLFPKMASFFRDPDPTYRIFIRHNVQKCMSGRGLHRGFVFAWTDLAPRDPDYTDEFLMHETVHNWPRLGHSPGGPTMEEMADGWFNEGIAEYYSLVLAFRFGIFNEKRICPPTQHSYLWLLHQPRSKYQEQGCYGALLEKRPCQSDTLSKRIRLLSFTGLQAEEGRETVTWRPHFGDD